MDRQTGLCPAEGLDHLVYDTFSNDRTTLEDGVYAILPPQGGD